MENDKALVQDLLEEVNLCNTEDLKLIYIGFLLQKEIKQEFMTLCTLYKDSFDWDYHEMHGLNRELMEHCLPTKPNFKPYQKPLRLMTLEIVNQVKVEIEMLLKAKFIKTIKYVIWLSYILPTITKNGKL